MRKIVFFIFTLLICMLPTASFANYENVKVTVPSFPISMNGIQVDNMHREYPFLMYKGITYFPLTYHDSRFLGIENNSYGEITKINKTGVTSGYRDYSRKIKNNEIDTAILSSSNLNINGRLIKLKYPLLSFRNITYLPLIDSFCSNEFGWTYEYDNEKGVSIISSNPKLRKENLLKYTGVSAILVDGYFYYGGAEGAIYNAPINDLKNFKKIYQLPLNRYADYHVSYHLMKRDGDAYLVYYQYGYPDGEFFYIKLNPDGSNELVEQGNLDYKKFGNITLKVEYEDNRKSGDLMIKEDNQEYRAIGDSDYSYYIDDLYLINNNIYALAENKNARNYRHIYKVNIDTNETTRISDLKTYYFKIIGNYIYVESEGKFYKIPLKGGISKEVKASVSVYGFECQVFNGSLYYVGDKDNELHKVGYEKSLNPGARVTGMKVKNEYLIVTFKEQPDNPYRIMVFDKNGDIVFKTSDATKPNDMYGFETTERIFIDKNILGYIENTTNNLYLTSLVK